MTATNLEFELLTRMEDRSLPRTEPTIPSLPFMPLPAKPSPAAPDQPANDLALDQDLLERLHAGDQDAATAIYVRYAERLLCLTRRNTPADLQARVDPEDIVQSVFRTFFRRAATGAYVVPAGEELWKLLLVMSLNKIRKLGTFHRAGKRDVRKTALMAAAPEEVPQPVVEEPLRLLELTIDEMLKRSPEHARAMIVLRIQGYDVAEIAQRTSRSKRSVERVLQGFRELLSQELDMGEKGGGEAT